MNNASNLKIDHKTETETETITKTITTLQHQYAFAYILALSHTHTDMSVVRSATMKLILSQRQRLKERETERKSQCEKINWKKHMLCWRVAMCSQCFMMFMYVDPISVKCARTHAFFPSRSHQCIQICTSTSKQTHQHNHYDIF